MKKQKIKLKVLVAFSLMLFACKKEKLNGTLTENSNQNSYSEMAITNYLVESGYNKDSINFEGDFVTYGYDACWSKKGLIEEMANPEIDYSFKDFNEMDNNSLFAKTNQMGPKRTNLNSAVKITGVQFIKIGVTPQILNGYGSNYIAALDLAIAQFNAIPNCRIHMERVTNNSQANVMVRFSNDPIKPWPSITNITTALAKATLPTNGNVGSDVWFRYNVGGNAAQLTKLFLHELCHNVGIHHQYGVNNTRDQIPNTPTGNEPGSIMSNIGMTNSLSSNDKTALVCLYPVALGSPQFASNSSSIPPVKKIAAGTVQLYFKKGSLIQMPNFPVESPYYWVRVFLYDLNDNMITHKDFVKNHDPQGFYTLVWDQIPSNKKYKFKLQGLNFRKDKGSPLSGFSPIVSL